MKKKILAMLLVAVMVVGLMPVTANAIAASCTHGIAQWTTVTNPNYGTGHMCRKCGGSSACYSTETIETVVDCNNGTFQIVRVKCAACAYYKQELRTPVDHTFNGGATCAVCGATNPDYIPPCPHENLDATGKCENPDCDYQCPHTEYDTNIVECGPGKYNNKTCQNEKCGATFDPVAAPAQHSFVNGACEHCGKDEPAPCEHTYEEGNIECTKCGEPCTHTAGTHLVYGHCVDADYDHQNCVDCGWTLNLVPQNRESHNWGSDNKCTFCGETKQECQHVFEKDADGLCDLCGDPCPDHQVFTKFPNCVQGGYKNMQCPNCDYIEVLNTPEEPKDHSFENGVCTVCGQEKPDSCPHDNWTDDGVCPDCGEVCGHDRKTTNTATCLDGGYETVTCKICKNILSITASDPLGHDWDDGVVTVKPTYTAKGEMLYTCERCGETMTVELDTLQAPSVPGTDGLDYVPKTGNVLVEWLYALIFG